MEIGHENLVEEKKKKNRKEETSEQQLPCHLQNTMSKEHSWSLAK